MKCEDVLRELDEVQSDGSIIEITPTKVNEVRWRERDDWETQARELDAKASFVQAANIFYTLLELSKLPKDKVYYGIWLAQMYVNASNLDKAEETLNKALRASGDVEGELDKSRSLSFVYEKLAWVADCRQNPELELEFLKKALWYSELIPLKDRNESDEDRLLTIEHFTGRALYQKIKNDTKYTDRDILRLREIFSSNLSGYQKKKKTASVAFNHAWLARTEMLAGNGEIAKEHVSQSKRLFTEATKTAGNRILGHYERLEAEYMLFVGESDKASEHAIKALQYTLPEGAYFNGVMESVKLILKASQ